MKVKLVTYIFKISRAKNKIFTITQSGNIINFIGIIFITDFTDNLFDQILECYKTGCYTIFIKYDGKRYR